MKKTLVLFRHGEAEAESNRGDHGRQLTLRGEVQATETSKAISELNLRSYFFLISDAVRARQTFRSGSAFFKDAPSIEDRRLYLSGIEQMRLVVGDVNIGAGIDTLVFVAHNPGLSLALATLACDLTGLSTADAAVLTIEAEGWTDALAMDGCWDVHTIIRG